MIYFSMKATKLATVVGFATFMATSVSAYSDYNGSKDFDFPTSTSTSWMMETAVIDPEPTDGELPFGVVSVAKNIETETVFDPTSLMEKLLIGSNEPLNSMDHIELAGDLQISGSTTQGPTGTSTTITATATFTF